MPDYDHLRWLQQERERREDEAKKKLKERESIRRNWHPYEREVELKKEGEEEISNTSLGSDRHKIEEWAERTDDDEFFE
jgi:hypothetical protein